MLSSTNGGRTPGSSDWTSPLRKSPGIAFIKSSDSSEKKEKRRVVPLLIADFPSDVAETHCMAAQVLRSPYNYIEVNDRVEKEEKEKEKEEELDFTPRRRPPMKPRILFSQEPTAILELALTALQLEEDSEFNLSELYQCNLDYPDESVNASEFFAIRAQVEEIEKKLRKSTDLDVDVLAVRERVSGLLLLKDFKSKMAELGVILFYMDAYHTLPEGSPLACRAEQIKAEVEYYLKEHAALCDDPLIPSGKTHYLLRAFSHMIFTSDQAFNKGSLYAIELLLTNPKFTIAKYLQPEHRDHILVIVKNLATKSDFETLFKKKYRVHMDLQDAIRIDLKLHPGEPITSTLVLYAVVMAHFVDIRQMDLPNCYAISAKDFVAKNKTYKSFKFLLKILEQGHYNFNNTYTIPLAPLLAKRLAVSQDLARKLPAKNASALIPIGHISSTLEVEPALTKGRVCTLKETLSDILEVNESSENLGYAETLYYAYKLNALVQLELAVLEFVYMNVDLVKDDFGQPYSAPKKELLNACANFIEDNLPKSAPKDNSEFLNHFKEKLAAKIWFENIRFDRIEVTSSKSLKVEGFEITEFQGDIYALEDLFKESLMLFSLHHGRYIPIKSITDLQEPMLQAAQEAMQEMEVWNRKCPSQSEIKTAITSDGFRVEMANYCAAKIGNSSYSTNQLIKGRDLNDADLLVFGQTGGQSPRTLDLVYGIKVRSAQIENCTRAFEFLNNLNTTLKKLDATLLRATPKLILRTIGVHAWTVSPSYWEVFFSNQLPFTDFIYEVVYDRAKRFLDKVINRASVVRILNHFTDSKKFIEDALKDFDRQSQMTRDEFCNWITEGLNPGQKVRMQKAVDEEFSKISLSSSHLKTLLAKLGVDISETQFNKIFSLLSGPPCLPHQFAHQLRKLLIEEGIAIINPYRIELLICEIKDLPIWFHLGDYNYMDQYSEDPAHVELGVGYSYFIKGLLYYNRDHQTLLPNSSQLPSDLSIVYPN